MSPSFYLSLSFSLSTQQISNNFIKMSLFVVVVVVVLFCCCRCCYCWWCLCLDIALFLALFSQQIKYHWFYFLNHGWTSRDHCLAIFCLILNIQNFTDPCLKEDSSGILKKHFFSVFTLNKSESHYRSERKQFFARNSKIQKIFDCMYK